MTTQHPRPIGAKSPRLSPSDAKTGYFRAEDGTRLFFSSEGEGFPLLFCYGLVCSSLHWTYQIDHFREKYRCLWFDYRGHHGSDRPKDLTSLSVPQMARDAQRLLDELNIDQTVVLGHSMGVNVALESARLFPDRVKALVLANGTARRPFETMFRTNAMETSFNLLKALYERTPHLTARLWKMQRRNPIARLLIGLGGFNTRLTPSEDIDLYFDQVSSMDPAIFVNLIRNYEGYDSSSWLHTVSQPTLIIAGEHDKVTPLPEQELLRQLLPASELEIVAQGSHCAQMDLPVVVNGIIESFLNKVGV